MTRLSFILIIILFTACKNSKSNTEDVKAAEAVKPVVAAHSDAFNTSFANILNSYYALRDGLIADDTAAANKSAVTLIQSSDALNLDELKSIDTSNIIISTAKTYTGGISSESKGLIGETDIEAKRKSFQMISAGLFDLVRTVRFDKEKVYLLNCPMAFDNTGADWLSNSTEIKNPYFGKKMLTCGSVKDSVVFK